MGLFSRKKKFSKYEEEKSNKESKTDSDETIEELEKNVKEIPDKKMDLFQPSEEVIKDDDEKS